MCDKEKQQETLAEEEIKGQTPDADSPEGAGETDGSTPAAPLPLPTQEEWDAACVAQQTLTAERDDYQERYLRLAAEYDNYRKRTKRERDALYTDVKAETIEKLLPVYDNLERALAQPTQDEPYRRGVELTMKGLADSLAKLDVTAIDALGKPFDPALHNAVMHIEDDSEEKNVIAEVLQTGFIMGEKVVRHSLVKVKN
jgi:molecular chaperone GrpE